MDKNGWQKVDITTFHGLKPDTEKQVRLRDSHTPSTMKNKKGEEGKIEDAWARLLKT